jgi:hypothetical protein
MELQEMIADPDITKKDVVERSKEMGVNPGDPAQACPLITCCPLFDLISDIPPGAFHAANRVSIDIEH